MSKAFKFAVLLVLILTGVDMAANPGDTTWVTIFSQRKLKYHGNYDTTATFPVNKRYRKIRLHYILGRYSCPSNEQYCGQWDYTTQIWARPANMDTVEIARVITPYAGDWLGRGKTHDYIVEVTDYATALQGTTAMRFRYDGYSWGFTLTLKIEFIEGVPAMDAVQVKKIYDGYFTYGNSSNSIENYLSAKTLSYATSGYAMIRNTVSGHGADATNCAEFCSKYYQLKVNGNMLSQKQLWRSDCGLNEVYPQTGTWIYDRANWCPGAVVWPIKHNLTAVTTANQTFTVDVDMQPYTVASASGGFNWVSHLVNYSAINHTLDASIEDIITPTADENYYRENPACSSPVIKLKNGGSDSLRTVVFSYGLLGKPAMTYTWTGAMGFLEEKNITLPPSVSLLTSSVQGVFQVTITSVNGGADQNSYNNIYSSKFNPAMELPKDFVVTITTNNSTSSQTQKNESSWYLYNSAGTLLLSRSGLNNQTVYYDTIRNLPPDCYRIEVKDSGCDGLAWWANTAGGTGSMRLYYLANPVLLYIFPTDIGCGFTLNFWIAEPPAPPIDETGLSESGLNAHFDLYPVPARDEVTVNFAFSDAKDVTLSLSDLQGRTVSSRQIGRIMKGHETFELSGFTAGVYFVTLSAPGEASAVRKLVISR